MFWFIQLYTWGIRRCIHFSLAGASQKLCLRCKLCLIATALTITSVGIAPTITDTFCWHVPLGCLYLCRESNITNKCQMNCWDITSCSPTRNMNVSNRFLLVIQTNSVLLVANFYPNTLFTGDPS